MNFEINKLWNSDHKALRQIADMFYRNNVETEGLTVNQSTELLELIMNLNDEIEVYLDECIQQELENERSHTDKEINDLEFEIELLKLEIEQLENELNQQESA